MVTKFIIYSNEYLKKNIIGYYHQLYTGYNQVNNPDFLNTLKNTYNNLSSYDLKEARDMVVDILLEDIPMIIKETNVNNYVCLAVPRSKSAKFLNSTQLMFKDAVSIASRKIDGVKDGTTYIERTKNTYTTHLDKATRDGKYYNDGKKPYPGITQETCDIDHVGIKGNNILLIDDIYTKTINIDEDCIQTILDHGAKQVVFYSIGYTRRL